MPDSNGSPTFEEWYAACDDICGRMVGLDLDSLGDGPSYDRWADGETPEAYVNERLDDAGYPRPGEGRMSEAHPSTQVVPKTWRNSGLRPSKTEPLIPEADSRGVARCPECNSKFHTAGQCRPGVHR